MLLRVEMGEQRKDLAGVGGGFMVEALGAKAREMRMQKSPMRTRPAGKVVRYEECLRLLQSLADICTSGLHTHVQSCDPQNHPIAHNFALSVSKLGNSISLISPAASFR